MKLLSQWKAVYLFLTPVILYAAIRYWNFNISAYSPFSTDYNPALIFPNSLAITVFSTLFIVSFGWYFGYNLEQYKLTLRTYSGIVEALKSVAYDITPDEDAEPVYNEHLEDLKSHLIELPQSIFNQLKADDKTGWFGDSSYSTSVQDKKGISVYLLERKVGLSLIESVFDDENKLKTIEESYRQIFKLISDIHGINYADCPAFLYRTVVVTCLVLNTLLVFYNWAAYGLYIGSVVIVGQIVMFLYMIDGIKTITPVFENGTQGKQLMKQKTDELIGELRLQLEPIDPPKNTKTPSKPYIPKKTGSKK